MRPLAQYVICAHNCTRRARDNRLTNDEQQSRTLLKMLAKFEVSTEGKSRPREDRKCKYVDKYSEHYNMKGIEEFVVVKF